MGPKFKALMYTSADFVRGHKRDTVIVILVIIIAALLIAGCAAPTQPIEAAHAQQRDSGAFAVATLAPFGSFEWQLAPGYTRLAVLRRQAARALDRHQIDLARAITVQARADAARRQLDDARAMSDRADKDGAERALAQALRAVEWAERALTEAR